MSRLNQKLILLSIIVGVYLIASASQTGFAKDRTRNQEDEAIVEERNLSIPFDGWEFMFSLFSDKWSFLKTDINEKTKKNHIQVH